MGQGIVVREIIDRHEIHVGPTGLFRSAKDEATDSSKTVDGNSQGHEINSSTDGGLCLPQQRLIGRQGG